MRGSIQKRPRKSKKDGKFIEQYFVVYDVGMKWDEKKGQQVRKQKWEKVESPNTLKHAEKLLAERLSQLHKGEFIEPTKMTFREFQEKWMEKYAEGQVRPSTLAKHRSLLRTHLVPAFGDLPLSRISIEDVQEFKSKKMSSHLSPQSVKHLMTLLRQVLGHAVEWGYIRQNPAERVKNPRVPKREMDCLSPEEVRLFLSHAPVKWYALFLVAVTTGLRIGELLAMKWRNVDWKNAQYIVRETLNRKLENQEEVFSPPKTQGSVQAVDLTPACIAALQDHRRRQAEEKLKAKTDREDHNLIFPSRTGGPLNHRNVVQRVFEPVLEKAGLRRIRFHDLRHTCASLLIAQGENPKYIQKQLRHASTQITFDRYGHLFPDTNQQAMRRMDEMLSGGKSAATGSDGS